MILTIEHGPIRELRLHRPPANALSPELITALQRAVESSTHDDVRALVLSGSPRFFSGGLDVPLLLTLDRPTRLTAHLERGDVNVIYPVSADECLDRMYWARIRFQRDPAGKVIPEASTEHLFVYDVSAGAAVFRQAVDALALDDPSGDGAEGSHRLDVRGGDLLGLRVPGLLNRTLHPAPRVLLGELVDLMALVAREKAERSAHQNKCPRCGGPVSEPSAWSSGCSGSRSSRWRSSEPDCLRWTR